MKVLLRKPDGFEGFGPSILTRQTRGRLRGSQIPQDRLAARRMLREHCPLSPGVYGWLDEHRQLVYVGKSKSLRQRLLSYFAKNPTDQKMDRIRRRSWHLVWEPMSHELLALVREQELIHRWRPEFNTHGQPTRRQGAYLCLTQPPAPHLIFAGQLPRRAATVFGPIAGSLQLRQTVVSLNQAFQLRDCPDKTKFEFNNQLRLFAESKPAKCIRYELGSCPGPCAGRCSARAYQANVDRAKAFLNGSDRKILDQLEQDMRSAAQNRVYERAAVLRDQWENLCWLDRRLADLRACRTRLNGVLPLAGRRQQPIWLVLRGGQLVTSLVRPDHPPDKSTAATLLERCGQQSDSLPRNSLEMNLQVILHAWFRKHPQMLDQLIEFETAWRICRQSNQVRQLATTRAA